jgi:predicted nucleic acid-binding protein
MIAFLLDTNVPSELMHSKPDPRVQRWFRSQPLPTLWLSSISIGEIRKGITLLSTGKRKSALEQWLRSDLLTGFDGRILAVTVPIAERWGTITAERRLRGIPLNASDGLIAATALEHDLTLVTRNVKDFVHLGVPLFNPWEM